LVIYTDGVTEALNAQEEEFGEERLIGALQDSRHLSTRDLLTAIVSEVQNHNPHEQHDDITLIVARCLDTGQRPLFQRPV
jgi:serine phosphatase RsbU (regulator of sigma subunit)